jgi:hypothetical protein
MAANRVSDPCYPEILWIPTREIGVIRSLKIFHFFPNFAPEFSEKNNENHDCTGQNFRISSRSQDNDSLAVSAWIPSSSGTIAPLATPPAVPPSPSLYDIAIIRVIRGLEKFSLFSKLRPGVFGEE